MAILGVVEATIIHGDGALAIHSDVGVVIG